MNAQPIYVFARWNVKPGNLPEVLVLLKEAAQKSREEEGNLFYKLHRSINDPNTIILFEGYANEAAAAQHRNSPHFQDTVVQKIIPLLENREVIPTTLLEL
jgi:quinol monooxygenase YgiN